MTGYWSGEPDPDYRPPAELLRFLEAGPPPVYFGLGGAVTRFDPSPFVGQNVTADGQAGTTEFSCVTVVGFDFQLSEQLGGRVIWRSYLMIPSTDGLPGVYEASGLAWDNTLSFGVRFLLAS